MLKIILVQGFCPVKSKITQFPNGFRLNTKFILVISKLLIKQSSHDNWAHDWYFNKFFPLLLLKTYQDNKWELEFWYEGLKG